MSQQGCGRTHALACPPKRPIQLLPVRIAIVALLLSLTLPATTYAATYTFTPVADAYTRSDSASSNFGVGNRISDRDATSQRRISYLRFNVALLPGETITSATVKLYTTTSGSNIDLRDVSSDSWTETGLTWNSAPVYNTAVTSHLGSFGKYKTISLAATPIVKSPGPASMALTTESSSAINFHSREAGSNRPQLVIQTALSAPAPPPAPGDSTAPDTAITSTPAASTTSQTASFSFSGSDETSAATALKFECSLDGGAYEACSSIRTYSGLSVGAHSFAVRASDQAGNYDASPAQYGWLVNAPADTSAPSAPLSLTATAGDGTAALSWSASSDNVGVTGYRLYRDGAQVAAPSGTSFTDTGLANGTSLSYTVKAIDAAGNLSAASNSASATPQAPAGGGGGGSVGGLLPARLPVSIGATFYVATSGSDSNAGTESAPWRTVQKALSTLVAGQTALVRGGTYAQNLTLTRAGTALAPITIREYPGEQAILAAGTGATNNIPLQLGNGAAYARFQGLTFHGATGSSTTNVYAWGNAHDIELSSCESRNSQRQGFFSEKTVSKVQIVGCHFHHNGGSGPVQLDHNVYIQGSYNAVIGSLLEGAVNGYGIQIYPSSDHAVIAGNTINGNFRDGIIIGSDGTTTTSHSLVVNNIITGSQSAISTYWGGSTGTGNVARNNIAHGNQANFTGSGITYSANTISNPLFVNAAAGDFHLQSASPALGTADPAYASLTDLDGVARPLGAGPDLGAFER